MVVPIRHDQFVFAVDRSRDGPSEVSQRVPVPSHVAYVKAIGVVDTHAMRLVVGDVHVAEAVDCDAARSPELGRTEDLSQRTVLVAYQYLLKEV